MQIRSGIDLTAAEVYAIWRIRDLVFSVEQDCREPDVDDRDLDAACHHLWFADDLGLTAYVRSYVDDEGVRHLGRVCTRKDHRGQGLAGQLIDSVHARWVEPIVIGAQSHLEDWYGSRGYVVTGPHFEEAGIDHVPMRRIPESS